MLAGFYGDGVEVELCGTSYKSLKVLDGDGLISEWPVFRRALLKQKQAYTESHKMSNISATVRRDALLSSLCWHLPRNVHNHQHNARSRDPSAK